MIREQMNMTPKGQVVIPQLIRKVAGLHPPGPVMFCWDGRQVTLERPAAPAHRIFEQIAKAGPTAGKIDPHEGYEASLEARWKKIERAARKK